MAPAAKHNAKGKIPLTNDAKIQPIKAAGISTIAEITDGNPPYKPNGCISQAWSVGALLHIKWLLEKDKGMHS